MPARSATDLVPRSLRLGGLVAALGLSACSIGAQRGALEAAIGDRAERARAFEAMAEALDEHPAYVDEFYRVARRHPAMLSRILADTTRDLRDPTLARPTADLLAQNPPSLEQILVSTFDAVRTVPAARAAVDRAVVARKEILADVVTDDHDAIVNCMNAVVASAERKPAARSAFLESMRASSAGVAAMLKTDPRTAKTLFGSMLRAEDHKTLDDVLRALGLTE